MAFSSRSTITLPTVTSNFWAGNSTSLRDFQNSLKTYSYYELRKVHNETIFTASYIVLEWIDVTS